MATLIEIWKNKGMILEGIKNAIFTKEDVEIIAAKRMAICNACPSIGTNCIAPGTQPCCGECGCSLAFKTRALAASCAHENPKWHAILTTDEEDQLNNQLNSNQDDNFHSREPQV